MIKQHREEILPDVDNIDVTNLFNDYTGARTYVATLQGDFKSTDLLMVSIDHISLGPFFVLDVGSHHEDDDRSKFWRSLPIGKVTMFEDAELGPRRLIKIGTSYPILAAGSEIEGDIAEDFNIHIAH